MTTKKDLIAQGYVHAFDWPTTFMGDGWDEIYRSPDRMKYYRITSDGKAYEFVSRGVE
jgi:hypothetical protein